MAGTLTISTLSDGTNSTSSTNCIQGSAKAWVSFVGSTAVVRGSYNVSSITRVSLGVFTVNMTNALSNANYAYTVGASPNSGYAANPGIVVCNANGTTSTLIAPTTSAFTFTVYNLGASNYLDPLQCNVIVLD